MLNREEEEKEKQLSRAESQCMDVFRFIIEFRYEWR